MSLNGQTQVYMPPTLDGLNIVEADQIYVDGVELDPTNIVPYTGASKTLNMGAQAIKTSYAPVTNADVVNLQTLQNAVAYIDGINVANFVKYTGAIQNVDLGSQNLTVGNAGQVSFSNLVKTELNNVLSGYTPASVTVGNNFGTITNAAGVYQSTSTAVFASLVLGSFTAGEKFSVSLSLKSVDAGNVTNLYLYGSTTPNMTGSTGQIVAFSIPPNTTGFTVFSNTITFPVGSTYLLLVYYSQKPSGIDTLYWNAFSVTGMGSVVKKLIAPTTSLDGANKAYVDTQDALRVPYVGASANVNLGSNSIIAATAQFTGVTSATPALALGVDGSGNLRSFAVPTASIGGSVSAGYVPYAATANTLANSFISQSGNTLSMNNFSVAPVSLGYTGASFTASTGIGSITYSAPTYTANSSASYQGLMTLPALPSKCLNNPCVATFTNLAFPLFTLSPYPYFSLTNGSAIFYSDTPSPTGTVNLYFTPTVSSLTLTIYFKTPPGVFAGAVMTWTNFTIGAYTATAPLLAVNSDASIGGNAVITGSTAVGLTNPVAKFQVVGTGSVCGGTNFANANNYMQTGSLTIGDTTRNYGGGTSQWNSNTAGLLMECLDNTEIAVHDAGRAVFSFMRYDNARLTLGRDMGWGAIDVYCTQNLACASLVIQGFGSATTGTISSDNDNGMAFRARIAPFAAGSIFAWNDYSGTTRMNMDEPGNLVLPSRELRISNLNSVCQLRMKSGNTNIASMFHCNGNALYILATNNGDWTGSYNSLRPLTISLAGDGCTMQEGLNVSGGTIRCANQPYVFLGQGGSGGSVAYGVGGTFGYSGYASYFVPYQSIGFTNTPGNGWVHYYGTFTAPWSGRYQININFYWNSYVAGNRWTINQYNSNSTLQFSRYCCIEGAGIGGDTVRSWGSTFYMSAGQYFQIIQASGSGTCNAYFGGETHSSMSVVFLS